VNRTTAPTARGPISIIKVHLQSSGPGLEQIARRGDTISLSFTVLNKALAGPPSVRFQPGNIIPSSLVNTAVGPSERWIATLAVLEAGVGQLEDGSVQFTVNNCVDALGNQAAPISNADITDGSFVSISTLLCPWVRCQIG